MYKLTDGGVIRGGDGAFVPEEMKNKDWRIYQKWLADGNTPDPADPTPAPSGIDWSDFDKANSIPDLKIALSGILGRK